MKVTAYRLICVKISTILSFIVIFLYASLTYADDFYLIENDDYAMSKAFEKAKMTLDGFLNKVDQRPEHISDYSAYVKYEDKSEVEYLWVVDVITYNNEFLMGVVVSKPILVTNVKYGATVSFKKTDIYDWEYYDESSKMRFGAFSTCALLKQNNEEDAKYIRDRGLQCKPGK